MGNDDRPVNDEKACKVKPERRQHKFVDNHVDLIDTNTTETDDNDSSMILRRAETKNVDKSAKDSRGCYLDDSRRVDF